MHIFPTNKTEMLVVIAIFISVTCHAFLDNIYNNVSLRHLLCFLHLWQAPQPPRGVLIFSFGEIYPYNSFSSVSQSFSSRVPNHPAKPLVTAHESVYNHISDHFFFQAQCAAMCAPWSPAYCEAFHSLLPFRGTHQSGGLYAAAVHVWVSVRQCSCTL